MTKHFDCVDMKHKAGQKIQKKIGLLTKKEEVEFWKSRTERLKSWKSQSAGILKGNIT